MNDLPRRKLRELVARDGDLIAENPPRTESLLRDRKSMRGKIHKIRLKKQANE